MRRAHSLAERFRRFAQTTDASLSTRVAEALSESAEALRAIETAPARRRQPALVLAALHDLALAGRAPELAAAYETARCGGDVDPVVTASVDTLVRMPEAVAEIVGRRSVRTVDSARCAVLCPAVAEAAHRVGADRVGLVDVDGSASLNLHLDGVAVTYDNGQVLGDAAAPLRLTASIVGDRPVPSRAVPEVAARVAVDHDPLDVADGADARWLRACVAPDDTERAARVEAELAVAVRHPPVLLRGDVVEWLRDALDVVPASALPVITTTWALSRLSPADRLRFLERIVDAAAGRPVAWVSVEGVGVAPAIPTFGDRRASGHSVIGLAVCRHSTVRTQAVGRCWSRGRLLSWLAGSGSP